MKVLVFISILICGLSTSLKPQIILKNPSFDGPVCDPGCEVYYWNTCDNWYALVDSGYEDVYPRKPFDGYTYILLAPIFIPNNRLTASFISQKLDCNLKKGKSYRIRIMASSYRSIYLAPTDTAFFTINLGDDSCSFTEELFKSNYIDFEWSEVNIITIPPSKDYSFFFINSYVDTSRYVPLSTYWPRLLLDDLSPIYPHNGNAVYIQNIADTTIESGACVQLQAAADITTYDTVFWLKKYPVQDGFRTDTIRNTFTLNDCPTASTTYIIALRDSVPDCAGIWWSYDTVRVTVNTGTVVAPLSTREGLGVRLFPNPTTNTLTIQTADHHIQQISICDVTGKSILSQQMKETTQTTILLQGVINTTGVYVAEITFTNGLKQRIKFLKQ